MEINSFSGEYRFLSNFYPIKIFYDGYLYTTVEHAYQAAKTLNLEDKEKIREASSPGIAKKLGANVTLRSDWEDVKISIMDILIRIKFQNKQLRDMLTQTFPYDLIEGNTWGDVFWGVCDGKGQNNLGILLMRLRNNILFPTQL